MKMMLAALFSAVLFAQPNLPQGRCRLAGVAVNSVTDAGVRNVRITLRGSVRLNTLEARRANPTGVLNYSTRTDSEGRFVFSGIDAAAYSIEAERTGFEGIQVGQYDTVKLSPGEEKKDVQLRMQPLAAVSGRILDADGFALRDVQLSLLRFRYQSGGRKLMPQGRGTTNDLGEYRIYDIPHGKYLLRATPAKGSAVELGSGEGYGAIYYPAAVEEAAAELIEIRAGQQLTGINLALPKQHAVAVRGRVVRPPGASFSGVSLTQEVAGWSVSVGSVPLGKSDSFEFLDVAPGKYKLRTLGPVNDPRLDNSVKYTANLEVQVGLLDVEGLELIPVPPVEIRGAARIEGKGRYGLSQVGLYMVGQNQTLVRLDEGSIREDGTFVIQGVQPDRYNVIFRTPGDLYIKSFRCGKTEISDFVLDLADSASPCPLEIVLSANGGRVEGKVAAEAGARLPSTARVTLISTDAKRVESTFRSGIVGAAGRFLITGVGPGAYRLIAWDDVDINAARYDPDFLRGYESLGGFVQVHDGGKEEVTLTLTRRRPE